MSLTKMIGTPGLGLIGLSLAVFINLAFYLGWVSDAFRKDGQTIRAEVRSAGQVHVKDAVKLEGKTEGEIRKIEMLPGARGAVLVMNIDDSAGPIYADARAEVRWKTLLGGAFYVAIDRGTPGAGRIGDKPIPMSRTSSQVELEDVTSLDQGPARAGLRTLPRELARALRDPKAPAGVVDTLAAVSGDVQAGLNAVRGQQPDRDLRRLVNGTANTVRALGTRNDDLRALVAGAAATLETTGARDDEVRDILDQGPLVTRQAHTTLARLDGTLPKVDRLVARLQDSAGSAAATLADLRPTLVSTGHLLLKARPLVAALRPTMRSLASLAQVGVPLLDALRPSLGRIDDKILPYLGRKDPGTGKSTTVMIGGTAAGFGGAASQMDQNGHFIRFPATGGSKSVHLPCNSSVIDPTAAKRLACESLQEALQNYLSYVPPVLSKGKR